jgi:hypothetical protein
MVPYVEQPCHSWPTLPKKVADHPLGRLQVPVIVPIELAQEGTQISFVAFYYWNQHRSVRMLQTSPLQLSVIAWPVWPVFISKLKF